MLHAVFATEQAAKAYQARCDKVLGYPTRGVHIGRGIHVDLDAPGRPGWTLHHDEPRKHPSKKQWAHAAVDPAAVPEGKVSLAEKAAMQSDFAKAETLGSDWDAEPAEPEPKPDPEPVPRAVRRTETTG